MNDFLNRISTLSPKRLALLALELHEESERLKSEKRQPIAIIGMACRFPGGADSPEALWQLLKSGRDAITCAPTDRWNLDEPIDALCDADGQPGKLQGGFLERVDLFDPLFFGISPREAETMDPQQRLLLEVAWEAFEDAALSADTVQGSRTGVFVGIAGNDFSQRLVDQDPQNLDGYVATGSSHAVAAGRLAYTFNLTGPCLSIDTACSSSLVAISAACDSLRSGTCSMALTGGVSLILTPETTLVLAKGGMLSPHFRCKSFDAAADGFARGEGCGLLVLKRLSDAERDGDNIVAVIRGKAVNQDGRSSGLTAPNGPAQESLLREALADADLTAGQVQFVEAHGTGTPLGDPIEIQALAAVFGKDRSADQPLLVSSIKTNFGHLEAAAGIAGLMKLALAIKHGEIPPLLHLKALNPHVDWTTKPLAFPTTAVPWPGEYAARVGGVSSFGFSGTNAHILIGAAPVPASLSSTPERRLHLLCLSAKSEEALRVLSGRYADFLETHREAAAADVCFTANQGRAHHEHRLAIIGDSTGQIRERLEMFAGTERHPAIRVGNLKRSQSSDVAFLFTGQGSQYPGMARELYQTQPTFRATLERCDEVLHGVWGRHLLDILFSDQGEKAALVNQTAFTQPALFAVEFALASLLQSWGVRPSAVLGHSVGEYVAACVAGVFSLEDGLKLVAARAELMQALPVGGGMIAILAKEDVVLREVTPFSSSLSIAAFNGPTNVVVSGPLGDIDAFAHRLEEQGLAFQRLEVSHAFHSALLDPMLDELERAANQVSYTEPAMTVISNITGRPATAGELRNAAYWRAHAREPVRFAAGVQALHGLGYKTFIEIGPNPVLLGMARRIVTDSDCRWLATLRRGRGDWEQLLETTGELYTSGIGIDWAGFERDFQSRKLSLPTYPFERSRYWPNVGDRRKPDLQSAPESVSTEAYRDWLYELKWQPLIDESASSAPPSYLVSPTLLLASATDEATALYQQLPPADDEAAYREIDLLCRDYILEALAALGFALRLGEGISTDALQRKLGVQDRQSRLFDRLLRILTEDGVLQSRGQEWIVAQTPSWEPTRDHLRTSRARHPQYAAELEALEACGPGLAEVLTGRRDPMQLLFPNGSLELTARLYRETRPATLFNTLIERCVTKAIARLPLDRPLRILEIGAGTGGTTSRVLPHLPANRASYWFTDVSPQFLDRARQRFGDYPFVQYQNFDLEQPAQKQGLEEGTFDIIIAANVLHATRDLRSSLDQVKRLMKHEGLLLLLEVVRPQRLGDLTVGMTSGWWSFTDTDLRPDYAILSEERWIEALNASGFSEPMAAPSGNNKTGLFANQSLLLARKPRQATFTSSPPQQSQAAGRWLIWSDAQGIGQQLAEGLRARGGECLVVAQGSRFESLGNGSYQIDPKSAEDHRKIIGAFRNASPASCRAAIHLWGLDALIDDKSDLPAVRTSVEQACRGALAAVQAATLAGGLGSAPLVFVTRGAQPTGAPGENPQPVQSTLWGFAGVVALEHPEFHCRRIDLGEDQESESSSALLDELLRSGGAECQIALRGGARWALRLKRAAERNLSYAPIRLRPNATYLVTGGLTGLGLETAGWLVDHGARHLALIGRRPPTEHAQSLIATWKSAGVGVVCIQADIGEASDAERVFATINNLPAPLRGVIHSAGSLDDAALLQQDWKRFERVLKAKVDGSWNLHLHTLTAELDFFVLYSSGASLLGSIGQANHAAANAFMDGLAFYRRSHGLKALSINWGAWSEIGIAASHDVLERMEKSGVHSIDTRNGMKALECLLASDGGRRAVLPIDWARFSGIEGAGIFSGLQVEQRMGASENHRAGAAVHEWQNQLRAATPARRRIILQELVGSEAAAILGLKSFQTIDPRQPLQELGLDSLMALQFRNSLSTWVAIELPPTLLYNYPALDPLAEHLTSLLAGEPIISDNSGEQADTSPDLDLDSMTEDDLAKLLEEQIKLV